MRGDWPLKKVSGFIPLQSAARRRDKFPLDAPLKRAFEGSPQQLWSATGRSSTLIFSWEPNSERSLFRSAMGLYDEEEDCSF